MAHTAGVYRFSDLPAASQAKDLITCPSCLYAGNRDNRHRWVLASLQPGNQSEAQHRDRVALVDGTKVTILAPSGNIAQALRAIAAERVVKGI